MVSLALLAQTAIYNHTQNRKECSKVYGVYQLSSSKEGLKLIQNYLLLAFLHTNFIQAECS